MIFLADPTKANRPKKNGRPLGKSTRWDNIQRQPASSQPHSHSPSPPLSLAVPNPQSVVIVARSRSISPTPSIGCGDESCSESLSANNKKLSSLTQRPCPTPSPTPDDHPITPHPIIRPKTKQTIPSTLSCFARICDGYVGAVLLIIGRAMLNTGQHLLEQVREGGTGVSSFKRLALANSSISLLPFWGMIVRKTTTGVSLHQSNCNRKLYLFH